MKPVSPARRRADAFSSLVDASTAEPRQGSRYTDELTPYVELVGALRAAPSPQARPEFVSDLRGRLMLAAETELVPATLEPTTAPTRRPAPRRTGRERRLAAAIGGFALVTASASMSVAAQSSLPGDTLYPLKRAIENLHEQTARNADDKAATMLDNASGRLDEVGELSRSGDQDARVIAETLHDFTDQAVEASDVLLDDYSDTGRLASIEELRDFTASSLDTLRRLEGVIPADARASLIEAAQTIGEIDREAVALCPACGAGPLVSALDRATDLGGLYDTALDEPAEAASDAGRPARPRRDQQPAAPSTGGSKAPVTSPEAEAPVGQPDPPVLPPAPTGDGGENGNGDDKSLGGSLGHAVTGLGDPVGDLLTGVGETVDDLTGGGKPKKK